MDALDVLGVREVATPLGVVEISLAGHEDGSLSGVAWLRSTGRRVGYLAHTGAGSTRIEIVGEPGLHQAGLARVMDELLQFALATRGSRLSEPEIASERRALLGLQWLLAELGECWELEELAEAVAPPALLASA
jgi:hypothetical protein